MGEADTSRKQCGSQREVRTVENAVGVTQKDQSVDVSATKVIGKLGAPREASIREDTGGFLQTPELSAIV